ncbi:hypothetical protein SB816_28485 [Achromobacter sp. SIMBA_011]|jgi:hypothetical protein|uniref:Uncharacterized protein n=1 Tax=Achromobacter dolens TaxID=1287738 RepID=A0A6S7BS43_9BURK|nr:hypothetical protein [Achromobacter dolens]MBQ2648282.1 hypothetical protein [Achromobacter sp.]MBQ2648602.1 hypothetical protein [Achromobacter sp.]MCZ8407548.1 hypothetical protein [Achromobacter dolens]CAB3703753.1 hypothetical protein LMG26840_05464 [Achromobacter dolens]CAB3815628.1 hypothetical protein LMG26841_00168 [Achromobacter dolens]
MKTPQTLTQSPALPLSTLLPPEAVRVLQQAARTPITRADPLARVKAIEKACERVRLGNPDFFR